MHSIENSFIYMDRFLSQVFVYHGMEFRAAYLCEHRIGDFDVLDRYLVSSQQQTCKYQIFINQFVQINVVSGGIRLLVINPQKDHR